MKFHLQHQPVAFFAVGFLALVILATTLAPLLGLQDPNAIPEGSGNLGPSAQHWLGTDQLGRDLFARLIAGARRSLVIGIGSALLATTIGVVVGTLAGWYGRTTDRVFMRATEVVLAFPTILLAACFVAAFGRGQGSIILSVGLTLWPVVARVTRTKVAEVSHSGFVEAARVAGAGTAWNLRRHVLPHVLPDVVPLSIALMAMAMLAEATLAFLGVGVGVGSDDVSWGTMAVEARRFLTTSPELVLLPALGIAAVTTAVMFLSDAFNKDERR